jgi:3-dehydrosphinganine reductase
MSVGTYFAKKHVLVTGGSSGIGLALARRLVELGSQVTLIARRPGPLEAARAELEPRAPGKVHALSLDISDAAEVERALGPHLVAHPADMLINNAGVTMPGRFLEMEARQYREQMEINYFGAVNMCRAVIPQLIARGGGHVVNVGSLLSVMGIYGYTAYAATKFALYGFSECLRAELLPQGVAVTVLLPPDTDTPQHAAELAHLPPETRAIAGNVKMLSAEAVVESLLVGMAARRFEVIPGMDGRFTVLANRWIPGVVRAYCDWAQRKAGRGAEGAPGSVGR